MISAAFTGRILVFGAALGACCKRNVSPSTLATTPAQFAIGSRSVAISVAHPSSLSTPGLHTCAPYGGPRPELIAPILEYVHERLYREPVSIIGTDYAYADDDGGLEYAFDHFGKKPLTPNQVFVVMDPRERRGTLFVQHGRAGERYCVSVSQDAESVNISLDLYGGIAQ